jgi:hypothetical protein
MELAAEKATMQGANRSNSELLREFATPQGDYFPRQVRPYELISASLDTCSGQQRLEGGHR